MKITLRDVIEILFLPLVSTGVWILWDMNKNINHLNIQVGIVITERISDRENLKEQGILIKEHELRIRDLEKSK